MPIVCEFLGIKVCMFFANCEHNPPHVHIYTSGNKAEVAISTGEIIKGAIADNKTRLVKEFMSSYKNELMDMWNKQEIRRIEK